MPRGHRLCAASGCTPDRRVSYPTGRALATESSSPGSEATMSPTGSGGDRPPTRGGFLLLGATGLAALVALLRLGRAGDDSSPPSSGPHQKPFGPTESFPVRNIEGAAPDKRPEDWVVEVDGLVERPLRIDTVAWLALPRVQRTIDLRCIEGWSVRDLRWEGVAVLDLMRRVRLLPEARFLSFRAYGGTYANSLSLQDVTTRDVLLADTLNGAPLPPKHGGPLRLIMPTGLGYQNVKWVARVEVSSEPHNSP
jgi:DMSO/TMAO reductase YedYZ molybdopterin-dependent catalytic subunit